MNSIYKLVEMDGRNAVITGAAGHIGQVIAQTLAELGANLVLVDQPGSNLQRVRSKCVEQFGVKVEVSECDLESQEQRTALIRDLKQTYETFGVLVNNAAFVGTSHLEGWATKLESQSVATWRRAVEVNLTAAFDLCKNLAPELGNETAGSIINIGSIYAALGPDWSLYEGTKMANPAAYAASKGGILQLTRWLATTLAPNVRVNSICPGGVYRHQPDAFVDRYVKRTPMGRMANEGDFCGTIAYLSSGMSAYVTGQNIYVDGGFNVW